MSAERRRLADGWELARAAPDACADPPAAARLDWRPARAGAGGGLTVAGTLGDAANAHDLDAHDWWWRLRVDAPSAAAGEELVLALDGLATVAEVWIDGRRVLESESMFAGHHLAVDEGVGELVICCRALAPRLAGRRRPRARWRTRVVAAGNLRFFRTMLLGRAPGFAPGPAVVGPWRPVSVVRRRGLVAESIAVRPRIEDGTPVVALRGRLRAVDGAPLPEMVTLAVGERTGTFVVAEDGDFAGELAVPGAERWWPHTHGRPVLHAVTVHTGDECLHEDRVGFRELSWPEDLEADGIALTVNEVAVFCRGAVWTPMTLAEPHADEVSLRPRLAAVAAAGLNMLRVPGTGCYESPAFHDLCDELGILVWQDMMFANLDYPESDPGFMATVAEELGTELAALAGRPSTAVVCGGSEVAQQVAMMGLDPALADGPLYGELLPRLIADSGLSVPYVPSAPWGGTLPFRPDRGVANYYGVGAYRRPLSDARLAGVRFASECLAFANVGDGELPAGGIGGAEWKSGVPRDVGAGWDFDDVRDHYLADRYGVDPATLRAVEPERYLALSRQVTGEVMAETFGEWRRDGSPCAGGLVLWLADLRPGAGWGLIDADGRAKPALAVLARTLAPLAVWTTDEGLSGIAVQLANDGPEPFAGELRVAAYRDGAVRVEEASTPVALAPHTTMSLDAEAVIGHFLDLGWAYRFGAPVADTIVATLHDPTGAVRSQAFRFPVGPPLARRSAAELGLRATVVSRVDGRARLRVTADRIIWGARVDAPGWQAADDAFGVEPDHPHELELRATGDAGQPLGGTLSALNLSGTVRISDSGC